MTKVYVITKGEYSDYSIYGVALDMEHAEVLKRYFSDKWDDAEIEEYDTDVFEPLSNGLSAYRVIFYEKGETSVFKETYGFRKDFKPNKFERVWMGGYRVYVWAVDEDHALKIASDKFAEYKYRKAMKEI